MPTYVAPSGIAGVGLYSGTHLAANCNDPHGAYTVTRQAIATGEELTCDYTQFDAESRKNGPGFIHGSPAG